MPETPKNKPSDPGEVPKSDPSNWSEDQRKRGYYYDDAHGYEVYNPENEGDDEDAEPDKERVTS
jgi:hypothetical protein